MARAAEDDADDEDEDEDEGRGVIAVAAAADEGAECFAKGVGAVEPALMMLAALR
jgi:hypothetical protein